ncbi:SRPBCC family protein [Catenulispora subtropica]|uniref:Polyketide cyclase/dehydrase n=1 Tax=Catenulispora subtropica TaxID=450798 RepID=A0ABN2QPJ2_9ACTN
MPELRVHADVAVPAERAWAAIADWESQGAWMIATRVSGAAEAVGGRLEGWTGLGPIGFLDTMTVTEWDPPHRCVVLHTGRVVRGTGGFEVAPNGENRCRITWWERVDLPLGAVGRAGWLVAGPLTRLFFAASLRRLKKILEGA